MPSRRAEPTKYQRHETINPSNRATLAIAARMFIIRETPMDDDPEHPIVSLNVQKALTTMDLTSLTERELVALRQFLNDVIDRALPIVQSLDRIAASAAENGDVSYKRLWRPDPVRHDFD